MRSRMNEDLLDALLMIQFNGPPEQESALLLEKSTTLWKFKKGRRFI